MGLVGRLAALLGRLAYLLWVLLELRQRLEINTLLRLAQAPLRHPHLLLLIMAQPQVIQLEAYLLWGMCAA